MAKGKTKQQTIDELQTRLQEMEDTLEAIRSGAVDAIVTSGPAGDRVYTLEGADHAYHTMVESMNEGALTLLTDGTILYCNRQFGQIAKASPSEVVGRRFHDFVSVSDQPTLDTIIDKEGHDCPKAEIRIRNGPGGDVPVQIAASPIELGGAKALTLVVTDLSAQKRYEEIVAAEKLSKRILEQAQEAIAVCIDGSIVRANRALYEICGCIPLMQPFDQILTLRMSESETFSIAMPESGKTIQKQEVRYQRPDGKIFELILSAGPLVGQENKVLGTLISMVDITERKFAEKALQEANESLEQRVRERTHGLQNLTEQLEKGRDDLRKLASELVMAEERERKKIAVTLHDEVAQTLAAAKMRLDLLKTLQGSAESRRVVEEAGELLLQSIKETRSLMHNIINPVLYDMGLPAAIQNLAEQALAIHGLAVSHSVSGEVKDLEQELAVMIYQAVRELLHNAVKHSQARNASVRVIAEETGIRTTVADDGRGFGVGAIGSPGHEGGFGLFSIRERVKSLNGDLRIESAPGKGTEVTIELPAALRKT
jgi:PAS domain S-box-containing protein